MHVNRAREPIYNIYYYYIGTGSYDSTTRKLITILLLYRRPHYLHTHTYDSWTNRGKRAAY